MRGDVVSTITFLGGGRITSAMLAGLSLAQHDYSLVVHDRNPGKLRDLKKRYAIAIARDLSSALKQADIIILAVRPSSIQELLGAITISMAQAPVKLSSAVNAKPRITRPALLAVSLAAGVPLSVLSKFGVPALNWARAMPSPVCRIGRGLTALTFPRKLSRANRQSVRNFFARVGQVVEIPESKFDAFTVTYSSSHGYHALDTLAKAAQKAGLDRKTALLASAHALADGIVAWRDGNIPLPSLLHEAVTPGGIAAATTSAMDAAGYERAIQQGIAAGLRRARANARK
jgi:pyrroline-5-carboxylate reductase